MSEVRAVLPVVGRWRLHPDRALPAERALRDLARTIYAHTAALPLVSMHGHVDVAVLAANAAFTDPAGLLVTPDHYIVRMLVSQGVPQDALGVPRRGGGVVESDPRAVWRAFCAHWHVFRGTPSRYWLEHVLVDVLGVRQPPSADSADALFDEISERLRGDDFRPLALVDRFGLETLATTDAAASSLSEHADLTARGWGGRIVPTFRPDPLLEVARPGWVRDVLLLAERADVAADSYSGFIEALEVRRAAFVAAGARATDHGHLSADTTPMSVAEASRVFDAALRGAVTDAEGAAFTAHMLHEMARMSTEDGLVMQLHTGVLRNHNRRVHAERGPDVGYDIPVPGEFTRALRGVLESFGHHPRLRLVVFTVDESTLSRELAPLAGVYPAMLLGAPWWFLDTADGMRRFREAVTESAGFYNTSGFVDDTRAFLSIPARHDLSRRVDAGYLARLVAEHRLELDEAVETAADLAYHLPRRVYAPPG